jgi:hypothetical protein
MKVEEENVSKKLKLKRESSRSRVLKKRAGVREEFNSIYNENKEMFDKINDCFNNYDTNLVDEIDISRQEEISEYLRDLAGVLGCN